MHNYATSGCNFLIETTFRNRVSEPHSKQGQLLKEQFAPTGLQGQPYTELVNGILILPGQVHLPLLFIHSILFNWLV